MAPGHVPPSTQGPSSAPRIGDDPLAAPPRVSTLSGELAIAQLGPQCGSLLVGPGEKSDEPPPLDRSLLGAAAVKGVTWLYAWKAFDSRAIAENVKPGMFVRVWAEPQPALLKLKDAAAGYCLCADCPFALVGAMTCIRILLGPLTPRFERLAARGHLPTGRWANGEVLNTSVLMRGALDDQPRLSLLPSRVSTYIAMLPWSPMR